MDAKNLLNGKLIEVDIDDSYELMSRLSKLINAIWITCATLLPYKFSHQLLVQSKKAETIKTYSTQYRALEEMYTYRRGRINGWVSFFDFIWLNQRNPRALRNRLKLFEKILRNEIKNRHFKGEIRILSLGSGSARGVIETIAYNEKKSVRALLIDKDINAIEYSKELAKDFKVQDSIQYSLQSIQNSFATIRDFKPDIVEMVGILDYLNDERVIHILNELFSILDQSSTVIIANINRNLEESFISRTVKWRMIHRTPTDLYNLISKTKYENNFKIIYEPLMVHGVAILRKS